MKRLYRNLAAAIVAVSCTLFFMACDGITGQENEGNTTGNQQESTQGGDDAGSEENGGNGGGGNGGENGGGNGEGTGRYDAPQLVDLGLPSGTQWAASDLGSTDPLVPGDSFFWGETEASTSSSYSNKYWEYDGEHGYATKYSVNMRQGRLLDMKTVLEAGDDAAAVNLGDGWRTPDKEAWEELCSNCDIQQKFSASGDLEAYVYTSRINGKSITFHTNGGCYLGGSDNGHSRYMSSNLVAQGERAILNNGIYALDMGFSAYEITGGNFRDSRMNIRPVFGGENKGIGLPMHVSENPGISGSTLTIGTSALFEEDFAQWNEYHYYVRLFDSPDRDDYCAETEVMRNGNASFTVSPGTTYYYLARFVAKKREGGYTYVWEGCSEVRSLTIGQ